MSVGRLFFTIIFMLSAMWSATAGTADELKRAYTLSSQGQTAASLMLVNAIIDSELRQPASKSHAPLLINAYSLCAKNYQDLGNLTSALEYYKRAISLAERVKDQQALAKLYNSLFSIYYMRNEYEQAYKLLEQALNLSLSRADTANLRNVYNNMGLVAYEQGNYSQALKSMDCALSVTSATDKEAQALIHTNRGEVFYAQSNYPQAEKELNQALTLLQGKHISSKSIQTLLNMALVKARMGKNSEARTLQQRITSLLESMPVLVKKNSLRQLAEINFVMGDSLKGLRNLLSHEYISDSLEHSHNESQLQQLLVAYNSERLRQNNENLQQTLHMHNIITYGSATFVLILAAMLFMLYRRMLADRRKSKLISKQRELLRQYEQRELLRKQQELTYEIDHKNRQLTSYTIDLASINEFHHKVQAQLQEMRQEAAQSQPSLCKRLTEVTHMLEHYSDAQIDDDFRTYFDEVHPNFLKRLAHTYPKLSDADLRLCAYLHLGMQTKEIAALTHKEVRSIESARNRLRKKLNIAPGTSIQDFLKDFNTP